MENNDNLTGWLFSSLNLCSRDVIIETVEIFHGAAVNIEPPVTDEVLLVVESSYGGNKI